MLPLARYRARRQLAELRTQDLEFSKEESAAFLSDQIGLDLAADQVVSLYNHTEGWIAGLQLAALALRHGQRIPARVALVSGRQRFIADYLAQDVLNQLPAETQDFLLKTSILARLSAPLCDAVTQGNRSQIMLESLERENLFILPMDDQREWYRYHVLFAEFLQAELVRRLPDEIKRLHGRAAEWYLAHDMPEQAFHHAVAESNVERVSQIFAKFMLIKLSSGELRVVERWLEAVPAEWLSADPVIGLARAAWFGFSGAMDACLRCIDQVEEQLVPAESQEARAQLGRVTAMRCLIACNQNDFARAIALAREALAALPEDDLGFRPGVYAAIGDTYRQNSQWEEAKQSYLKALDYAHAPLVQSQLAHVFGGLADLALRQSRLHEAFDYWKRALAVIQDQGMWSSYPLPVIGWVYIRMAEILYEWDQKVKAAEHVTRGLERAEMGGDVRARIAGYLIASRLQLSEANIDAADTYLERARPLVTQASFPEWTSQFARSQVDLWLAQNRFRDAERWAADMLQRAELKSQPENEWIRLAVARVLTMTGGKESLHHAHTLLEELLAAAERVGRRDVSIEALALEGLAQWKLGHPSRAMAALERALRLAEPEGYVRLFIDLKLPMARLLQEAHARGVMPDYVARLFSAFDQDAQSLGQGTLPEPLTAREQQILQLIAAGLTNQEIAVQLVISPETAKKHTGNIYSKLGVSNRTQAVAKARQLHLFD